MCANLLNVTQARTKRWVADAPANFRIIVSATTTPHVVVGAGFGIAQGGAANANGEQRSRQALRVRTAKTEEHEQANALQNDRNPKHVQPALCEPPVGRSGRIVRRFVRVHREKVVPVHHKSHREVGNARNEGERTKHGTPHRHAEDAR